MKPTFEVALLGGREVVIEDDRVGMERRSFAGELFDFALSDESGRLGFLSRLKLDVRDGDVRGGYELFELVERFFER